MSLQGHMFLPPSGAAAWRLCALWPLMNQRYPESEPSPESLEGTAAHWVWQQLWRGHPVAIGDRAPNGVEVDDEMLSAAELFCGVLHSPHPGENAATHVEEFVTGTRVHPTLNGGTPDVWRYSYALRIYEFKYGHRRVPAYENWQTINYAALLFDALGIDGIRDQTLPVEIVVVQPRHYGREGPVRKWTMVASELRGPINVLRNAADLATRPNPTATPGPEQCEFCPGRHACPALQETAFTAVDHSQACAVPLDMPTQAAARELTKLTRYSRMLNARITGLQEQVAGAVRRGERAPGWHLEPGSSRERWKVPPEQVKMLGVLYGTALEKPSVVTPYQARAAGIPEEVVERMSERPPGAMKLTQDDEAVVRQIFGK